MFMIPGPKLWLPASSLPSYCLQHCDKGNVIVKPTLDLEHNRNSGTDKKRLGTKTEGRVKRREAQKNKNKIEHKGSDKGNLISVRLEAVQDGNKDDENSYQAWQIMLFQVGQPGPWIFNH